jgi:hypothetical protein
MNLALLLMALAAAAHGETWRFDNLKKIGGHAVKLLGEPRVIDTPKGKATEFDGVDDALFFDVHPLAGATGFTYVSSISRKKAPTPGCCLKPD